MEHLDSITQDQLRDALSRIDGNRPTQRIITGIAYKNGISQTELADWFGVERKTIYNWLKRLEDGNIVEQVTDEHRSGRPRKLREDQLTAFQEALQDSPKTVGFDRSAWTSNLAQQFLREEFDVEYSLPSCRRLMKEAGLTYEGPPGRVTEADEEERDTDDQAIENRGGFWTPQ
ncbi:MAG: winged helix-turn-helix domain-containing protein [Halodesulfurarchaeum sp.]